MTADRSRGWAAANQALLDAEFAVLKARLARGADTPRLEVVEDVIHRGAPEAPARDDDASHGVRRAADSVLGEPGLRTAGNAANTRSDGSADTLSGGTTDAAAVPTAEERAAQAALDAARAAMPGRAPIDVLADAFDLSTFERALVVLVAGTEMDPALGAACGQALGHPDQAWATFGLALDLLPDPHWSALARTQPLRRWRLIEMDADSALVSARLRLDERVLHYLAGLNLMDARLVHMLRPLGDPPLLSARQAALAEQLTQRLTGERADAVADAREDERGDAQADAQRGAQAPAQAGAQANAPVPHLPPPLVMLHGDDGSAREDVAARCAALLGVRIHALDAQALPNSLAELIDLAVLWEREAALGAGGLFVACDNDMADMSVGWSGLESASASGSGAGSGVSSGATSGIGAGVNDVAASARAKAFAEIVGGLVFLGGRTPIGLRRPTLMCAVERPSPAEQRALWTTALGDAASGREAQIEAVAGQFRLSARGIHDVAMAVLAEGMERDVADGRATDDVAVNDVVRKDVPTDHAATERAVTDRANSDRATTTRTHTDRSTGELVGSPDAISDGVIDRGPLWAACRQRSSASLGDLAQRIDARATWDDLILPAAQKKTLAQIVTHLQHRRQVHETWGFAEKGGRGLGITALFAGDSGTGKTFAAEVLANTLSLDLFRVDLSGVVSKYIGETEKNLRRVFDAAEEGGAMLLFDEADALFGKRSDVRDSHDRYANVEVSYLLQRMETYRGLAILTTNHKAALDPAFQRRLRFVVSFPFPEAAERERLWEHAFPQATPTDGLVFDKLARLQVSGGQIQNLALGAAFLAAADGGPVTMTHLLDAVRTDGTRLERPVSETETRGWV